MFSATETKVKVEDPNPSICARGVIIPVTDKILRCSLLRDWYEKVPGTPFECKEYRSEDVNDFLDWLYRGRVKQENREVIDELKVLFKYSETFYLNSTWRVLAFIDRIKKNPAIIFVRYLKTDYNKVKLAEFVVELPERFTEEEVKSIIPILSYKETKKAMTENARWDIATCCYFCECLDGVVPTYKMQGCGTWLLTYDCTKVNLKNE